MCRIDDDDDGCRGLALGIVLGGLAWAAIIAFIIVDLIEPASRWPSPARRWWRRGSVGS